MKLDGVGRVAGTTMTASTLSGCYNTLTGHWLRRDVAVPSPSAGQELQRVVDFILQREVESAEVQWVRLFAAIGHLSRRT